MLKAFRTALLRNSPQHHSNRPGHFGSLETRRDEELPSFSLPSFLSSFFTVHNQSIPSRRENFRDYSRQSRSYFFYIFTTSNPIEQSLHPYYHTLRFFFFFFFFFFFYNSNWKHCHVLDDLFRELMISQAQNVMCHYFCYVDTTDVKATERHSCVISVISLLFHYDE